MRKLLVKVKDTNVVEKLYRFGEVELVSKPFNIYSLDVEDKHIKEIRKIDGVINVESEECYMLQ